jgi:transposase
MICDSHGNPLDFVLTQGQINDCTQSSTLLAGREAVAVIADKGYDDDKTRTTILDMNAVVVIPPRSCRKTPIEYDSHLYKARHAVEMVRLGTCGSHNPPNWHGVPSDRRGCIAPARPVGGRAETKERRWGRQTGKRKGPVFRWRPETRSG